MAVRRRLHAADIRTVATEISDTIDIDGFRAISDLFPEQDALKGAGSSKYNDFERWILENVDRYYRYGLNHLPPRSRILDIGCGSGFFLLVCQQMGHSPLGLDSPVDPIYRAQTEFLGVERIEYHIDGEHLAMPELGRFAAITSFMTGYNLDNSTGETWDLDRWLHFIESLSGNVEPKGKVVITLNEFRGELYPRGFDLALAARYGHRASTYQETVELSLPR